MSSYNVKEMMSKKERLAPGHRMCAGCGATIGVRAVLRALHEEDHAVIANATGCLEGNSFFHDPMILHGKTVISTMHLKMQEQH